MEGPVRIIIADDHRIFRDGFKVLLKKQNRVRLIAEAENGEELLRRVAEHNPDVVITDIKMPVMDGVIACKLIQERFPDTRVIALSMFNDDNLIVDMLEAGANGYLLKNTNKAELLLAVQSVFEGGNYYCDATSEKLTRLIARSSHNRSRYKPMIRLSEKEKEIIRFICQQFTNKEIASLLNLSVRTIESHREKIQEKTDSKNSVGIVIYAIRNHIFQL